MLTEETVEQRLSELHHELEHGYRRIASLDKEREETRDTILRIKGAIQVLEELSQSDSEIAENAQSEDPGRPRVASG